MALQERHNLILEFLRVHKTADAGIIRSAPHGFRGAAEADCDQGRNTETELQVLRICSKRDLRCKR